VRWKNPSATGEYISTVVAGGQLAVDRRPLSDAERLEETLFMGLRLTAGLDLPALKIRYGVDVWDEYGSELQPFVDAGLLVYDGRSLRMSRPGMLLAHEVMTVFIRSTVR
jgi:oxygen-independent coproporphyrinogen-3 oxidase